MHFYTKNYKTLLRVVKDLKLWRMRESARQRTSSQVGSLNIMSILLTWGYQKLGRLMCVPVLTLMCKLTC